MRWNLFAAVGLLGLSLVATVIVACSSSPSCKPGTINLTVTLLDTAPLADTITVTGTDAYSMISESFPHTPSAINTGFERTTIEVTFPDGYPADKVVHLVVRAMGGTTLLGAAGATIHTDPSCSVGSVNVSGGAAPMDGGTTD